ncbi:YoaK family protein [Acetobacter sp.]|uniref:YoaK family protein n=1 Tax=Acetobacter sp. TaxID=440 RepID=UPI0039E84ACE
MLVHEGAERDAVVDRRLGCSLAAVAGAVNAAGFLAVGYYSANMTGNVSTLATGLHAGHVSLFMSCIGLIGAFVAGAVLATLLVNAGRRRVLPSVYAWSILLEACLLGVLALVDILLPGVHRGVMLAYGLSFLMGLQNATVTRISGARVRTTHMTGMLTDVGIELADWLDSFRHPADLAQLARTRERLWLHGAIVVSFTAGGIAGAFLYGWWSGRFLLLLAGLLACLSLPGTVRRPEVLTSAGTVARENSSDV